MISFSEEIANLYYMKKRYFVRRNLYYLGKVKDKKSHRGNIDIDLVALKGDDIKIVSCKRGSLSAKELKKELRLFKQAEEEIKIQFPWIKKRPKYVYFYEWITKRNNREQNFFRKHNIEYISLEEAVNEILPILKKEMGTKEYDGKETEILPRMLKFLIKYHNKIKF